MHFGEFQWAFFNRRQFVRQWSRNTKGLTEAQIRSKFHTADINGDGKLSPKEFHKLLKSFNVNMQPAEVKLLMQRFDSDHDGFIDLNEFRSFIESEQQTLEASRSGDTLALQRLNGLPQPKGSTYARPSTGSADRAAGAKPKTRTFMTIPGASGSRASPTQDTAHRGGKSVTVVDGGKMIKLGSGGGAFETVNMPEQSQSSFPTEGIDRERGSSMTAETTDVDPKSKHAAPAKPETETLTDEPKFDPMWMARILQAQAEVEARLGRRYYS